MKRSIVPVALFLTLILSVVVSLPLKGSVVVISVIGFTVSLAGLAWWVLWADRRHVVPADVEPLVVAGAGEYTGDDWDAFERAFWAHVAEHEATSDLD
ncbi:MAG: hypothetical protein QOJ57_1796 [Thermoleophilaceae bacterium]|jgi:hypothetical protein|nr:hypothetical protein [Thermoleophilaceae bacterium]